MKLQTLQKEEEYVPNVVEEDEELEHGIAAVLLHTGYKRDTSEWTSAMLNWKLRRESDPRAFRKFMDLD